MPSTLTKKHKWFAAIVFGLVSIVLTLLIYGVRRHFVAHPRSQSAMPSNAVIDKSKPDVGNQTTKPATEQGASTIKPANGTAPQEIKAKTDAETRSGQSTSSPDAESSKLNDATISFLYGLLATLMIAVVTFAFDPFKKRLELWLATPDGHEVRILMFGQTGSGKTTFAEHALYLAPLKVHDYTEGFKALAGEAPLSEAKMIPLIFGDYYGQQPSTVTVLIPEIFAGPPGRRIVDVLIFFVDLIGREYNDELPKNVLDDEGLLDWLAADPAKLIETRIKHHKSYLGAATIEILFSTVLGERLKKVYFVVTKADLLRKAMAADLMLQLQDEELKQMVFQCFQEEIDRIQKACEKPRIEFSKNLISLRDESARNLISDILN